MEREKFVRVALCDDDGIFLEILDGEVLRTFREMGLNAIADGYTSGSALLHCMGDHDYAAVFLDMSMPDMDGLRLAQRLRRLPGCPAIIFVTSKEESVFSSFSVHPFGFVRKSRLDEDLRNVLGEFVGTYMDENRVLEVTGQDRERLTVRYSDIVWIESSKRMQIVRLTNGKTLTIRSGMAELEEKLKHSDIRCVHRCYFANFAYVTRIDRLQLRMTDGQIIPIGRGRTNVVREEYLRYIGSSKK